MKAEKSPSQLVTRALGVGVKLVPLDVHFLLSLGAIDKKRIHQGLVGHAWGEPSKVKHWFRWDSQRQRIKNE